jgi:SNF2 family DNA or RNA helicase
MACFNQQRTGKTPTSIRVMADRSLNRVVVTCPASALYPWGEEFVRWSGLPAVVLDGTKQKKIKLLENWEQGGLIISYGTLKSGNGEFINRIRLKTPEGLILDEAHRIKDRTTQNAEAAFALSEFIPYRLALTGTPAPNKPHEIWSILHFLYPKEFYSYWKFVEEFFYTYLQTNSQGKKFKDIGGIKPSKQKDLQIILAKCATQRKRKDVMQWLPDKEPPIKIHLPPTREQEKYLKELKDYFETEHIVTQGILDRLTRYRQICLAPDLLGLKSKSPKLEWIKNYLVDYPERPTIIFSKYTSFLHILEKELTNVNFRLIVGDTPVKTRAKYVTEFQSGLVNLLLINIDAGKESLTLDKAETIIFTDKYPPVGDIEQAEDRIIATTEEKANIPKTIYELIIKGTYDEQLYELLEKRAAAVDAINNFQKYMKGEP